MCDKVILPFAFTHDLVEHFMRLSDHGFKGLRHLNRWPPLRKYRYNILPVFQLCRCFFRFEIRWHLGSLPFFSGFQQVGCFGFQRNRFPSSAGWKVEDINEWKFFISGQTAFLSVWAKPNAGAIASTITASRMIDFMRGYFFKCTDFSGLPPNHDQTDYRQNPKEFSLTSDHVSQE